MTARYGRGAVAVLALLALVAAWNVLHYPPGLGYDASHHIDYAERLLHGQGPPNGTGEYYTPPGFYAVAAAAIWVGQKAGLGEPLRVVQLVNAGFLLGTAVLLLELARLVFAGRRRLALGAVALLALGVLAPRSAAMVHPEVMSLFFCTLALVLAARMVTRASWGVPWAVALGLALGAGQLVRAFSLWTFAVVVLTLAAVAVVRRGERTRVLAALAVAVVATAVVAGPWYAYQANRYTNPIFDRPTVQQPLWKRRPASFYVDLRLPQLFTKPTRGHLENRFAAEMYADGWGDYYGVFVWHNQDGAPTKAEQRSLAVQMWLALLPTVLLVGGWVALVLALLRGRLRDGTERLLVVLLPLAGLAGMLYFTVSYPTADSDTIKATYMLTSVPAWALCFGYGLDRILARRPRWTVPILVLLALFALSGLRLAIYGTPLRIL